ncbi:hypothetical protein [Agarilytica rhodophyticola]|uniref:hypothetical protein n=1 Tax=Agarilytica rhodophyticola TaxID=1737490 RepID=UPI001FE665A3|nr:hypothetical protein [Agarilytica rhodophyticola]
MDESLIDQLINKYEADEQKPKDEVASVESKSVDPGENAQNLSKLTVKGIEILGKAMDRRVGFQDDVFEEGKKELSPFFEKYNLGIGVDSVPYSPELRFGWFIGKLLKSTWLVVQSLKKQDKKKEAQKDGDKREHNVAEPPHAVSSEERPREEPVHDKEGGAASPWFEGDSMGHE